MVTIKVADPVKLQSASEMSAFVSFPYDSSILSIVRGLRTRVYLPEEKCWEIPDSSVPVLLNRLQEYDVTLTGAMQHDNSALAKLPEGFVFKTKPFQHQLEGIAYGLEHDSFLLGDDQGLGKTHTVINIALCKKQTEGLKHCLIICGINGTKYNWQEEIHMHSNEEAWVLGTRYTKKPPIKAKEGGTAEKLEDLKNVPSQFFWITNIESLRGGAYKDGKGKNAKRRFPIAERIQELIEDGTIGMVAFDEAHKAKNPDSQQGRALLMLTPKSAIPMSGTFLLNSPLDLYLPLRWAGYEDHSYYAYKNHYCRMGGFGGKEIIGYKNLDELRDTMSTAMLRRTKEEVLDLPPKVHTVCYVDMTAAQKKLYEEVRKNIKDDVDKIKLSPDPLASMLRLRQVTGCPEILSTKVTESAKMDRLVDLVDEVATSGEKCIVYSQWSTMTGYIRQRLSAYSPAYITGDIDPAERQEQVHRFQEDPNCKVIIGTIGALGTGLTLTAASTVIFLDEPWNRATKDQAEDRAHRIGTQGTVRIVTLVAKDSVDEGIYNLVQKKGRMGDLLIDGKVSPNNTGAAVDYLLSFGE